MCGQTQPGSASAVRACSAFLRARTVQHPSRLLLCLCCFPCACAVFASRDCVANGLFMGCSEFQLLAAPADWWLLQWLGSRFAVFVAPNDVWFKAGRLN